jgi:DNA-binding FadR family transcriptional regulator
MDTAPVAEIRRSDALVDKVRKQSVMLARDLANYISDEGLPEGAKLPTEQEMVIQFGVGRNTIREALRLLEMRGVITIRSGRGGGPVVRIPRSTDLSEALQLILQFQSATLSDVMEARLLIEPMAASAAAVVTDADSLEVLQSSVDSIINNPTDEANFTRQNNIFHATIGRSLQSPVMSVFLDSLKNVQDGVAYGIRYAPRRRLQVAKAHQRVIDRIAQRDADASAQAMREHLGEAKRYWATKFPQVSAKPLRWLGD